MFLYFHMLDIFYVQGCQNKQRIGLEWYCKIIGNYPWVLEMTRPFLQALAETISFRNTCVLLLQWSTIETYILK